MIEKLINKFRTFVKVEKEVESKDESFRAFLHPSSTLLHCGIETFLEAAYINVELNKQMF